MNTSMLRHLFPCLATFATVTTANEPTIQPNSQKPNVTLGDDLLDELAAIAQRVGADAAAMASQLRREGVDVAATKTSAVDVVTEADRAVESYIREELARLRPQDGFFGEESEASESESGLTWVVDPIDGTVNYLYGIPNYAVSIAAVTGDPAANPTAFVTHVGVVAAPDLGETFVAVRGRGAWRNDEPLSLGEGPASLEQTLVATGFSYQADRRKLQAQTYMAMADRVRDLRRLGAASLDLCAAAAGRIDVYYEFGLKPWDWAAGALVAREAGAKVSGMQSAAPEGRGILVCAHPTIAADFLELLHLSTPADLL